MICRLPERARLLCRTWCVLLACCLTAGSAARGQDSGRPGQSQHLPVPGPPPGIDDRLVPVNWWNVIILVNANSPASIEVAKMYREFYPGIADDQVLYLGGLRDCASLSAGPQDEILTRAEFENLIAEPLRDYLWATGRIDSTYILLTTAGIPYRIEDTAAELADVIMPAGSNPYLTASARNRVNAASVEAELAVLWQIDPDPALAASSRMPINGRVVNPYQGYRSGIKRWAGLRDMLGRRVTFRWATMGWIPKSPLIEGLRNTTPPGFSAYSRRMSPADIYLVARLDGPRAAGEYPVFAVRRMLERSAAATNPAFKRFVGYNPQKSVVVVDHTPAPPAPAGLATTYIFNFPPQYDLLIQSIHPVPPGAEEYLDAWNEANHFVQTVRLLSESQPPEYARSLTTASSGLGAQVLWDDTAAMLSSAHLPQGSGIISLQTFGKNANDGCTATYLLTDGPGGGPLFRCAPGAVFTSLESFNYLTLFTSVATSQGKVAEFIAMGGTAAIGHSFEPEWSATIQGEFLIANLLRDDNRDGLGDLSFVEAAYSAIPYLSWSEVVLGDPLMRLRHGPGGLVRIEPSPGDVDGDGLVGFGDLSLVLAAFGNVLGDPLYYVPADQTQDGVVDGADLSLMLNCYGTVYPQP